MKHLFLFLLLGLFIESGLAQTTTLDTIVVKRNLTANVYYKNGTILKPSAMLEMFDKNSESYTLMNQAKTNNGVAAVFSFIGGFMIGYELANAVMNKPVNAPVVIGGITSIGIAIPFSVAYNKKSLRAVQLYNGTRK